MNYSYLIEACQKLGIEGPFSFEQDGKIWTGTDENRIFQDESAIYAEASRIADARTKAIESARAKLAALGLDADEVSALFGI